jgi:outer membrane protein assembly factor BamB
MNKSFFAMSSVLMLSACGGGGGGGSSAPPPPPLQISLSATSGSASATEGNTQTTLTTTATLSGTIPAGAIADVQYDKTVFASVTAAAGATSGTYTITAQTLPDLGGGDYKGNITFRLCREVACTNVHTGSATTYNYDINVKLQDWQTHQRNASHTGYVHVTLDPTKFAKAWEWRSPLVNGHNYSISPIATGEGNVYLTSGAYGSNGVAYGFNENTGAQIWKTDIPYMSYNGTPAYSNGKVHIPIVGSSQNHAVYTFEATTGNYLFKSIYYSQWTLPGAPVPYKDSYYLASGYYGGETSSHSQLNGDIGWRTMSPAGAVWGGESPAVDELYVYYSSGWALTVFERATGAVHATISDTPPSSYGYSDYSGGPIIGANGSIISFTGNSSGPTSARPLSRIDIATKSFLWRSAQSYIVQPAYAKGLIYTAKNATPRFEVINESDGSVAWTWVPPIADNSFISNAVVTDNLAFISTDLAVYAIDLTTRQSVWSYPIGGNLAISPGYRLYIQPIDTVNSGRLIAISLR